LVAAAVLMGVATPIVVVNEVRLQLSRRGKAIVRAEGAAALLNSELNTRCIEEMRRLVIEIVSDLRGGGAGIDSGKRKSLVDILDRLNLLTFSHKEIEQRYYSTWEDAIRELTLSRNEQSAVLNLVNSWYEDRRGILRTLVKDDSTDTRSVALRFFRVQFALLLKKRRREKQRLEAILKEPS
jgi:hypothetical protein